MTDVRDMSHVFLQYGTTALHPLAVAFTLGCAALVWSRRRSRVVLAVLLVAIFVPAKQRLVLAGLDFGMLRLVLMWAWLRILVRGEWRGWKMRRIDRLLVAWIGGVALIHVLRVGGSAIAYRAGTSLDALMAYFFFRVLVRDRAAVFRMWRGLAGAVIVLGTFAAFEWITKFNPFHVFGSAPMETVIRDGVVRCQGPFSHPILFGTFGAVVIPPFVALGVRRRRVRWRSLAAAAAAVVIVFAAGSSGPLIALGAGIVGGLLWPLRARVRTFVRIGLVLIVIVHFVREKPVWHLIGRVADLTGGTGYHRYFLIDAFVRHLEEWALLGTDGTAHWGWGLQDTTNQYVNEGVQGGLLGLVLFVLLLVHCFRVLRRARMRVEAFERPTNLAVPLLWAYSVSLAMHCVSFVSVSYFGQMSQVFLGFLATIPGAGRARRRPEKRVELQR